MAESVTVEELVAFVGALHVQNVKLEQRCGGLEKLVAELEENAASLQAELAEVKEGSCTEHGSCLAH